MYKRFVHFFYFYYKGEIMKRTAVILLAFCIVLLFSGCTEKHNEKLPAASVKYLIKPASEETEIDDVIAAFSALCKSKECSDYIADGDAVEKLGKAGNRYELYRIVPSDATGAAVMTYGTFQGFEIVSGMKYSPSEFALCLFDTRDKVMYTIEDGEGFVDFSEVYRLLPQNMKR